MSDMKCPFCQQEMICGGTICHYNPDCPIHDKSVPTEVLDLLECTRKALDVAVDALGYYASENSWDETNRWMFVENGFEFAKDVLEQITALTKGAKNE